MVQVGIDTQALEVILEVHAANGGLTTTVRLDPAAAKVVASALNANAKVITDKERNDTLSRDGSE